MTFAQIALSLAGAALVQTTLVPVVSGRTLPVDLVLVVVVFAALARGPVVGVWVGTAGGWLQDVLSGGLVGVSGLAKTIAGAGAGLVGVHFLVGTTWHRTTIQFVAAVVHAACYLGVYALVSTEAPAVTPVSVGVQIVVTTLAAGALDLGVQAAPSLGERFRGGRRAEGRRRWMTT